MPEGMPAEVCHGHVVLLAGACRIDPHSCLWSLQRTEHRRLLNTLEHNKNIMTISKDLSKTLDHKIYFVFFFYFGNRACLKADKMSISRILQFVKKWCRDNHCLNQILWCLSHTKNDVHDVCLYFTFLFTSWKLLATKYSKTAMSGRQTPRFYSFFWGCYAVKLDKIHLKHAF